MCTPKFKEGDVVLNTKTGEEGMVWMIYDKGEFNFYIVQRPGKEQTKDTWPESSLELIWRSTEDV